VARRFRRVSENLVHTKHTGAASRSIANVCFGSTALQTSLVRSRCVPAHVRPVVLARNFGWGDGNVDSMREWRVCPLLTAEEPLTTGQ
jgi:hypothetical protein